MCFTVNHYLPATKRHKRHIEESERAVHEIVLCLLWLINASCGRCGDFFVGKGAEAEATDFSIEGRAVVVEDLRGLFDVATGAFECLRDRFALDVFFR